MTSAEYWRAGITVFCSLAVLQSFFLAIVLTTQKKKNPSLIFLSLALIGLGLRIAKSIFSHFWVEKVYWGVLLGCIGLWLIGPSLILYSKKRLDLKFNMFDIVAFLPAVGLLAFSGLLDFEQLNWAYRAGTVLFGFHLVHIYTLSFPSPLKQEKHMLLLSMTIVELAFITQLLTGTLEWYVAGSLVACISLYLFNFVILKENLLIKKYRHPASADNTETLRELESQFLSKKLYASKGLTISEVSNELQIPAYLITRAIQQTGRNNFNQWVNSYRVEEIKKVLHDSRRKDKVEHLAKDFGFSSTSTLYQAFKQETGLTLNQYRKQVLKDVV